MLVVHYSACSFSLVLDDLCFVWCKIIIRFACTGYWISVFHNVSVGVMEPPVGGCYILSYCGCLLFLFLLAPIMYRYYT